jgi:serine/threonine-protein phosphatase 5
MKGRAPSKRGVALSFGPDVTENFLKTNNLKYIVRSHEVRPEGYEFEQDGKCITVFSAPNYCDQVGNKGAYLHIKRGESKPTAISFTHVPHPGKKPMQYSSALGGMLGM